MSITCVFVNAGFVWLVPSLWKVSVFLNIFFDSSLIVFDYTQHTAVLWYQTGESHPRPLGYMKCHACFLWAVNGWLPSVVKQSRLIQSFGQNYK